MPGPSSVPPQEEEVPRKRNRIESEEEDEPQQQGATPVKMMKEVGEQDMLYILSRPTLSLVCMGIGRTVPG